MNGQKGNGASTRISLVGLFAILSFVLTLPVVVFFAQQPQQIGSKAFFSTPISPQPPASYGYIAGYVFQDNNQNGIRDPEEKPYPHLSIKISTIKKSSDLTGKVAQIVSDTTTDSYGYFFYNISDPNTRTLEYVVRVNLPNGYKTIDTNPVLLNDLTTQSKQILQFGLFPIGKSPYPTAAISHSTCLPRPKCLDTVPRCLPPEPVEGWCTATPIPLR